MEEEVVVDAMSKDSMKKTLMTVSMVDMEEEVTLEVEDVEVPPWVGL